MERANKLADLTLVSKYYPVANYSYPRNESTLSPAYHTPKMSDRSSLDSEGSAPGLVDDRSDSEVSGDDDYQYRALTAEIWDTFWKPEDDEEKKDEPEAQPQDQYPALIPSPQRRRKRSTGDVGRRSPGWPLPDSPPQQPRGRQPAATYSPFPKPIAFPTTGKPAIPSWQSSRSREAPRRPPRPDERLLTPCLQQQQSPVTAGFTSFTLPAQDNNINGPLSAPIQGRYLAQSPEPRRPGTAVDHHRSSISADMQRPRTSYYSRPPTPAHPQPRKHKSSRSLRPVSPAATQRPRTSLASRPPTPFEAESPGLLSPATHCPMPDISQHPAMAHKRSMSRLTPEPEPRSFFEEDSEGEDDGRGRSFFRFHKRSGSDLRSARSAEFPHHGPLSPAPVSPRRHSGDKNHGEKKRGGSDVIGRMLGRRSR